MQKIQKKPKPHNDCLAWEILQLEKQGVWQHIYNSNLKTRQIEKVSKKGNCQNSILLLLCLLLNTTWEKKNWNYRITFPFEYRKLKTFNSVKLVKLQRKMATAAGTSIKPRRTWTKKLFSKLKTMKTTKYKFNASVNNGRQFL